MERVRIPCLRTPHPPTGPYETSGMLNLLIGTHARTRQGRPAGHCHCLPPPPRPLPLPTSVHAHTQTLAFGQLSARVICLCVCVCVWSVFCIRMRSGQNGNSLINISRARIGTALSTIRDVLCPETVFKLAIKNTHTLKRYNSTRMSRAHTTKRRRRLAATGCRVV